AYGSSSLTAAQSYFEAGTTAYVKVTGLKPGQKDWSVTWLTPGGTTAAANTGGGDRPDSDNSGVLASGSYLQYIARPTPDTGTDAIQGTAEANALVQVWVDVNNNGVKDAGDTPAGSQQLAAGATAFSVSVPLTSNAANHFLVTATDAAGNTSAAAAVPTITE